MIYLIIITVAILIGILIHKRKQFTKWLVEDLGERKIMEIIKNNYLFPIRFWWKWNLGKLKNVDIDKKENREITFIEDFSDGKLNRDKWNTSFPWGRGSSDGGAWATDGDNLKFFDNKVQFLTKYEPNTYSGWWGDLYQNFTTAHLNTKNKFQQQFGKFEIKLKLTDKKGLWPAFWLLTENFLHPDCPRWATEKPVSDEGWGQSILPEVDIFEQFGSKRKQMQFTLHSGLSYSKPWHVSYPNKIKDVDLSENFIKISVEITKDYLKWYINDCLVKVLYQKHLSNDKRVFRPLYLIVSTGSSHNPDKLVKEYKKDNNYLPDGMIVDWVRVYKPLYYGKAKEIEFEK